MSHFSTLKVQVKQAKLAADVAAKMGWACEHAEEYHNPWKAARESVKDCTLYRDAHGKVKLIVDGKGNVIHDAWSMGKEAFDFLRQYSEQFIRKTAASEGAQVHDCGVDAEGCRVLEIEYAF